MPSKARQLSDDTRYFEASAKLRDLEARRAKLQAEHNAVTATPSRRPTSTCNDVDQLIAETPPAPSRAAGIVKDELERVEKAIWIQSATVARERRRATAAACETIRPRFVQLSAAIADKLLEAAKLAKQADTLYAELVEGGFRIGGAFFEQPSIEALDCIVREIMALDLTLHTPIAGAVRAYLSRLDLPRNHAAIPLFTNPPTPHSPRVPSFGG